jgi:transposase InsO family protein
MSHRNAPLTPEGRRRLCERVDRGRPICHVAAEAGISRQTLGTWHDRWLAEGEDGLVDRSSRPHHCPNQTPPEVEARVCQLRRALKVGPVQLSGRLGEEGITVPSSTIHRILVRHGISRLRDLDVDGEDLREPVRRYEYDEPGGLIHVDVKKLGRIPDGGGWRIHGRGSARHRVGETARHARARARRKGGGRAGYVYLHTALDDHSRLSYTEELLDEKGTTAAGFWARAVKFFRRHGIRKIKRVLSDNGACYRSLVFAAALAKTKTRHQRTRPYRPQTNGKVERYHRTLAREWAYQQAWDSNHERTAALPTFLQHYNYARPHTALNGRPPVTRTPIGVTNLAG